MTAQVSRIPSTSFPLNRHGRPPRGNVYLKVASKATDIYQAAESSASNPLERATSMPVSASSPVQTTFPSFMSVFGNGTSSEAHGRIAQLPTNPQNTDRRAHILQSPSSLRRGSSSTFESTESSPTTTVSTVASSLTEPSPNSSPESPNTTSKLNSIYLRRESRQRHDGMERREQFSNSFPTLPGIEKSESPQKKMRNMKNLSVNTAASNRTATAQLPKLGIATGSLPASNHASSAPPTPAFIVPPKPPRRKPSNLGLSITTPESNVSDVQTGSGTMPQVTPDPQIKTFRRLQSSVDGPLQSPTVAPEGGMRLPPFAALSHFVKPGPPLSISPGAISSPIKKQTLEHVKEEPDYEVPLSQEAKSPSYPQGPVCIYDPYVYLYLEPTRVEASEFDVILNVAKEVSNPFKARKTSAEPKMVDKGIQVSFDTADKGVQASFDETDSKSKPRTSASEPQTATSEVSFSSALEVQTKAKDTSEPSTPKPLKTEPEYIHVPWDHNTNVVEDLLKLCELIDNRVQQRKRVLVHCQCGVSRSASLVVAYGMYRNPGLTVQEAYDAVKDRSKWIGPNMNLIYQLSEFKGKLARTMASGGQSWQQRRTFAPDETKINLNRQGSLGDSPAKSISQAGRLSSSAPTLSYLLPASAKLMPPTSMADTSPGPLSAPPKYESPTDGNLPLSHEAQNTAVYPLSIDPVRKVDPFEESMQIFSPTVQETQPAPLGAVASDLRAVAKNLDSFETGDDAKVGQNRSGDLAGDSEVAPPGSWPEGASESPLLATKPSISNLKMGFSRLFSKNHPLEQLTIRPASPHFGSSQDPSSSITSVLVDDVPPTPSLLSPRAAEFTASPFHRTVAGDLAGSSSFEQGLTNPRTNDEDPRSPPQKGEAPITRSIDDIL